ncbi:MAG: hypothetical protein HC799_19480 [Limnothrix sp. RL_2_0]|nr:hypothetical protein [Limnothrix sp. RL_2_0]
MHPMVKSLIRQVPPPSALNSQSGSWHDVEAKLGMALPDDYKSIIEIYGDYYWDKFLYLLNPFSPHENLNLFTQLGDMNSTLWAERVSRQNFPEHYPLPLYPEPGGLLPLLITDNGDTGFWITQCQPDKWPILLKGARAPEFEVHFFSTALFLLQFSGYKLRSLIFPEPSE